MNTTAKQRLKLLLALPILVLIGWFLYEAVLMRIQADPRWVMSAGTEEPFGACHPAEQHVLAQFEVSPVDDPPRGTVTQEAAKVIISRAGRFFPLGRSPTMALALLAVYLLGLAITLGLRRVQSLLRSRRLPRGRSRPSRPG